MSLFPFAAPQIFAFPIIKKPATLSLSYHPFCSVSFIFTIKMPLLCYFFIFYFGLHVTGQHSVELLTIHDHHSIPVSHADTALVVPNDHLKQVSRSVLSAESWTRTHVLSHYPTTNITTIVVGHTLLCEKAQEEKFIFVLPSLKNIHYTLTRWGLHREIKVSASFSSACLLPNSATFRADMAETYIKPLLSFLQDINSSYVVIPSSHLPTLNDEDLVLLKNHSQALKHLGFFHFNNVHMVIRGAKEPKPTSKKLLTFLEEEILGSFPTRPTPLSPTGAPSIGSSVPSHSARSPIPPSIGTVSPPPLSLPFPPENHPMITPAQPPFGFHLPPCKPSTGHGGAVAAPVPSVHGSGGLWCVAKPSVPAETLQEALDYACGQGGADCAAIKPRGSCYYPNTLVAHASYAYNSYWQKNKEKGGSCGFGGTAILINSDPSYGHCRFTLGW